ncbi:hypothetical protein EVAR_54847_1 [Eumeta japonica]|uniref:Uncharacterized protein n=1 Tax=Eumeta variegata TaxID=151549 RepID=A0A4C1SYY3_EUMVA|nr:hypothetical protein EVAR_54847_1 [Eumeta japonica]
MNPQAPRLYGLPKVHKEVYKREVTAFVVSFRAVSESSGGPARCHLLSFNYSTPLHQPAHSSINLLTPPSDNLFLLKRPTAHRCSHNSSGIVNAHERIEFGADIESEIDINTANEIKSETGSETDSETEIKIMTEREIS